MKRVGKIIVLLCMLAVLMCGCTKDPYANMKMQVKESTVYNFDKSTIDTNPIVTIYNILNKYMLKAIVVSVSIGVVIMKLFSEELGIQKKALFTFIIGIPITLVILYYLFTWLAGIFT